MYPIISYLKLNCILGTQIQQNILYIYSLTNQKKRLMLLDTHMGIHEVGRWVLFSRCNLYFLVK